jgi:predicted PurR-regulated permease PerM
LKSHLTQHESHLQATFAIFDDPPGRMAGRGLGAVPGVFWLLAPVLAPICHCRCAGLCASPIGARLEGWGRAADCPAAIAVVLVEALALAGFAGFFLAAWFRWLVREWPLLKQQLPLMLDRLGDALNPLLAQLGLNVSLDFR